MISERAALAAAQADGEERVPRATSTLVAVFYSLYFLAWTLLPLAAHEIPPGDNFEQLSWSRTPAWGYPKHPPFPTWVLWVFEQVFPRSVALTYALGGLEVAVMLAAAWALTRETLGPREARIAPLLITCISYYDRRMHFFNHNTALLVACALSSYCVWRATQSRRAWWWLALGACWGVGLLSKYQMAVPIACNVAFLWSARSTGIARLIRGGLLSLSVCALMTAPHLAWLVANGFPTFDYAAKSLGAHLPWTSRLADVVKFLVDQSLRVYPLALLLGALVVWMRRRPPSEAPDGESPVPILAERMLTIHAWGPLLIMVLLSLLFGVDLQAHWGTAFLWMLPIWLLSTARGRALERLGIERVLAGVAVLQLGRVVVRAWFPSI